MSNQIKLDINQVSKNIDDSVIKKLFSNKDILIYGAGTAGKGLYENLNKFNFQVKHFLDKNSSNLKRVDILEPNELNNFELSSCIIIISCNSEVLFQNIKTDLFEITNYSEKLRFVDGRELNYILNKLECDRNFEKNFNLDINKCSSCRIDMFNCESFRKFARKNKKVNDLTKSNLNELTYILTTACTLKCKDCVLQIPYIYNKFIDYEKIKQDLEKVCENIIFLDKIVLMGGELFLHKDLNRVLNYILNKENIGFIYLNTTGMIIPNEEIIAILRNSRITLNISDYNHNTDKSYEFVEILSKNNINYVYSNKNTWFDVNNFESINKKDFNIREKFKKCIFTNCSLATMHDGIIYRCSYQMGNILSGKHIKKNTLNLEKNHKSISNELNNFLNQEYIEACKKCGMSNNPKEIPAGIQLKRNNNE